MFQTFISRHNSNFFSDKLVLTSVTPASSAPVLQTPKATSSTLYFDSLTGKIRGLMVTVCPSQFATRRTLFHVLVGCGLLMLKVSRLKLPVIWLLVSMWLNTL